jgi:membrane-bound lytic murein transglycosylase D
MKHTFLYFLLLFTVIGSAAQAQFEMGQPKKDSSFVAPAKLQDNPIAAMLDSLATLQFFDKSNNLYDVNYSNTHNFAKDFVPFYSDEVYMERFSQLGKTSPIPLVYNRQVKDMIELYAVKKRALTERMLGLAQLYFPMIEELLDRYGIPLEMKYLAIVESALNPIARSPVGAGGLWQFMYGTGKQYNLDVNSYVDDRSDPYKSTIAACKHLNDLYKVHKNWLLVLAAYNSGTGNVTKAIRRSGGKIDFWEISPYLPQETRGYVPAFIAVTYVMNHASDHNLIPRMPIYKYHEIDTVLVKDFLTFDVLAERLNVSKEELLFLNPAYRKGVIPSTSAKSYFLRLPKRAVADFVNNEASLYAYNQQKQQIDRESVIQALSQSQESFFHYVKNKESLATIANHYGVSVNDIRQWNHITKRSVYKGQRLIINKNSGPEVNLAANKQPQHAADSQNAGNNKVESQSLAQAVRFSPKQVKNEEPEQPVTKLKHHIVKKGQKMSEVAKIYGVSLAQIKSWNKLKNYALVKGQNLKIYVTSTEEPLMAETKPSKTEKPQAKKGKESNAPSEENSFHKVKAGESLALLSRKFNVTSDQLKEWNNLNKKGTILPGQNLIVSKTEVVQKEPVLASNDRKSKNQSPREEVPMKTYLVKKGDSYSSIATKFSISVEDLRAMNAKLGEILKFGQKLFIRSGNSQAGNENQDQKNNATDNKKQQTKTKTISYKVQPGDTLWGIATKKGTSIDDIKKWNNLKSEEVIPGQVIKIIVNS